MKRLITLIVLLGLFLAPARASHVMGGEITWVCQPNGQFVFTLKVYLDCTGTSWFGPDYIRVWNYPGLTQIPVTMVSNTDISPQCFNPALSLSCNTPVVGTARERVMVSAPITLTGTPPAQGWVFTWDVCCRNSAITNLDAPGSKGHTLRAIMYAYTPQGAPTANNTNPCYDSSPQFLERPSTVLCTGFPFTYNHNAVDADLDSLHYELGQPLDDMTPGTWPAAPLMFAPGYSIGSPMPGPAQNPNNVAAVLNPTTGEISLTNFTPGSFVTCIKVEAWRCGQKIAEVFRDLQVVYLGTCATNFPPVTTVSSPSFTQIGGNNWVDTVFAGELVQFNLQASDFDLHDPLNPSTIQYVRIEATGGQFGTGYTSTTGGCFQPPCATLTPVPPIVNPIGGGTTMNWQTTCAHLSYVAGCGITSNTYNFLLKAQDDACPAPATAFITVSITVLPGISAAPTANCVSLLPNGDIEVSWNIPLDTGLNFNHYEIYYSPNPAGPFNVIDSVFNWGTDTYTHVGPPPGPAYYYVRVNTGCDFQSGTSDTLSLMNLTVNNPAPGGVAFLDWTPPSSSASGVMYYIFKEFPAGVWTLIDSTTTLAYLDTITQCGAQINYQIVVDDPVFGCRSTISGGLFGDIIAPVIIPLDSASVNIDNNLAVLSWPMATDPDAISYIVYLYDNTSGAWVPVDTVFNIQDTVYTNLNSNAGSTSEIYGVAVLDSCDNRSPISFQHQTMYLQSSLDVCLQEVSLQWNAYTGWPVTSYNVYMGENGAAPSLLTNSGTALDAIHQGLTPFSSYCYFIEAIGPNGETARSNQLCVFADIPVWPNFLYTRYVTVNSLAGFVEIMAYVDTAADINEYIIERSNTIFGPYTQIASLPQPIGGDMITHYDMTAVYNNRPYYYRIMAVDSCGTIAFESDTSNSIYLDVTAFEDLRNELDWTDYGRWDGGVESYNIYRVIDAGVPTLLDNVPGTVNFYVDDLNQSFVGLNGQGSFCYFIEALEGAGNSYGFQEVSLSNLKCVAQNPRMFIPNAFNPNSPFSDNRTFKPSALFLESAPYEMFIYNRWGQLLFYTTVPSEGWNGTYNDEDQPGAVYMYRIRYTDLNGEVHDYQGHLTLIR